MGGTYGLVGVLRPRFGFKLVGLAIIVGLAIPLTDEQLAALQTGRQIFFSRELGARYFTYRRGGETRFVLLDDGDTLHRKIALGERLGIHRGLLTLPECADILRDLTG